MPSFALTPSGLDTNQFPPIAFVDADGTLFEPGTDTFLPGAEEKFRTLATRYRICLFTARGPGPWLLVIEKVLGPGFLYMQKPLGSEYALFDDRLVEADTCLPSA